MNLMVNLMQVGDKVRVRVQAYDDWIFAKDKRPIHTYEGTVVKSSRLDPPETFCLLTGNPNYPVSIIALKNLVGEPEILGRVKLAPSPNEKKVIVVSESGNRHEVTLFNTGLVKCDCKGFQHHHKCSHQQDTLEWLKEKYGTNWNRNLF